jgi:DNA (cytosine-5)-methyltransferase 1
VYLKTRSQHQKTLELVVIAEVHVEKMVTMRRLRRLERDCLSLVGNTRRRDISKNELVWADEFEQVNIARLNRKCHIRFLPKEDLLSGQIPTPYDRRGNGDFWFFSTNLIKRDGKNTRLDFLDRAPKVLFQGPNLNSEPSFKKLISLSIFSGSGNFDRGLEEGGAVDFRYAVDFSAEAIHMQKANARHPAKLNLYCGSVDDYLKAAINGKRHKLIARIGEVLFIAGGSPCPGFSLLQMDPFGERCC